MTKIKHTPFEHLKLAVLYAYKSAPKLMRIRISLILFQSVLPLIPLYLIKLLVDGLANGMPDINQILYIILAFGLIKMLIIIINNYAYYCTEIQGQEISNYMSKMVIDKAVALEYKNYENPEFNNSFHRARSEAHILPADILTQMTVFLQHSLTMLTLIGFLFTMHWMMTVILIFSALPVAYVKIHFSKEKWELYYKNTLLRRKSQYYSYLLTNPHPAKELHVFGFGNFLKNKFVDLINDLLDQTQKLAKHSMRTITLVQMVDVLALVFALYFIANSTIEQSISIGSMVMFYQGFIKAQGTLGNLFQSSISVYYKRLFFADFVDFMNIKEKEEASPISKVDLEKSLQNKGLVINNLFFKYPATEINVLKNINLNLPEKGLVAIIGQNGSGKSSLIKLICGLYKPTKGEILINKLSINNYTTQENISALFQDFVQYDFDVGENISISAPNTEKSTPNIHASLTEVNMDKFVNKLPKGIDTYLSKSYEKGTILSGGQWQRIALARALYKKANIYILDEPTSFIDPHHEYMLLQNIRALANEKLVLLVTHKLYNLKQVDHLIVMDKGAIIDQGSYEEVFARCTIFRDMVSLQSIDIVGSTLDG